MKKITVIFLFVILTIGMTFPLLFNFSTMIPGFHSTDEPFGALWKFWWFKYAHDNGLGYGSCGLVASPFGYNVNLSEGITYPVWTAINRALATFTTGPFTYNVQIFLSFILGGFFVYLLACHFSGSFVAALFAGIIYAFCPYHFARSWQHLGLAQIQWMPLYVLSLLRLREKGNGLGIFFAAVSLNLVIFFDYYYSYFMLMATGVFLFYCAVYFRRSPKTAGRIIFAVVLALALSFIMTLPANWAAIKSYFGFGVHKLLSQGGAVKDFGDLFKQSARPLSYILPFSEHPLLGGMTRNFIGSPYYGESFTEHALFLGWAPMVLAFVAVREWIRRRRLKIEDRESKQDFALGFFVFLSIAAWLFSQPPWWRIGPVKIYMPSFFMFKLLPMFRAYCRFGVVLMLAISVLAGAGLTVILQRFKTRPLRVAVAIALTSLVIFEFWNWPPFKVIDVSKAPQAYYWLKEEKGDFAIAEYPLDITGANETFLFYQTIHAKKIINGTEAGTVGRQVAQTIADLSSLRTAEILKRLGVRYVLVHKADYLNNEEVTMGLQLEGIVSNPGLKRVKNFPAEHCTSTLPCTRESGPVDVYEVVGR